MNQSSLKNDGLYTHVVGDWAEEKYKLVGLYDEIFSTAMKNKWDKRVYIDLFCGPGKVRLREKNKIVYSSPLIALTVKDLFDKYIFCDRDQKCINALESRVNDLNIDKDVHYISGDCNENVEEIANRAKYASNSFISFCFVDPFGLGNLSFNTIKFLSSLKVDFLILLPSGYDVRRNVKKYIQQDEKSKLDKFLGTSKWRESWEKKKGKIEFTEFFVTEYIEQMVKLGYIKESPDKIVEARSNKRLFLYHLSFFSRDPLGHKIWSDVKKYSSKQTSLF